jgi:hypothetical protein
MNPWRPSVSTYLKHLRCLGAHFLGHIYKYLTHVKATAAMLLGTLFIALGMHWLDRLNQQKRQISGGWLLLLFLILSAAFAALSHLPETAEGGPNQDTEITG